MTPTFIDRNHDFAVIGTPGGSRIISMNLLAILDWMEGKSAAEMVAERRYHHQFHPDQISHEPGMFTAEQRESLEDKGHVLFETERDYGNMQVITYDGDARRLQAASDPRGIGGDVWVY